MPDRRGRPTGPPPRRCGLSAPRPSRSRLNPAAHSRSLPLRRAREKHMSATGTVPLRTVGGPGRPVPTLLGVWAHPDDEAYLSAGLLASAVDAGWRVVVATATRGEIGTDDPEACPPDLLAGIRASELADSLRVVG